MKAKIKALKERHMSAKTDAERDAAIGELGQLHDSNPDAFAEAMVELAHDTAERAEQLLNDQP